MRSTNPGLHSLRSKGSIAEICAGGRMLHSRKATVGDSKTGSWIDRRMQALTVGYHCEQRLRLASLQCHQGRLFSSAPWQGSIANERSRAETLSKGRPSDIIVLVKNEEIIPCPTDSERYLLLHRGRSAGPNRSETGGAVHAWLRVQTEGVYGLETATNALASELLATLLGSKAGADATGRAGLGVLGYACDPACLRSLVEDNLRVGLRHLDAALGADGAAELLRADGAGAGGGLQALLLVCWGAAPVQAGGRSAERKYVDLHVHLSPVPGHTWLSEEVRPPPTRAPLLPLIPPPPPHTPGSAGEEPPSRALAAFRPPRAGP